MKIILTLSAFCENDVPYISYDIQLQGIDPSGETAMFTWTGAGGETEIETGLGLSNTHHLWAGAEVDGSGNGIVWPGWNVLANGDSLRSDGGDALGTFSIILMMFLTLMTGLYFARKEETKKEELLREEEGKA